MKQNGVLRGTKLTPYPFELHISTLSSDGASFQGHIVWPTLQNCKTKVKGTLDRANQQLTFEEYDLLEGDAVELPNLYVGGLSAQPSTTLQGTFHDNLKQEGRWRLDLQ